MPLPHETRTLWRMTSDTAPATLAELTPKQQRFADGLMAGLSQADAYRAAYDADGMSSQSIRSQATELAQHPSIAPLFLARRAAASDAVDAAVVSARLGAPGNLARLDAIAALPIAGDKADTRALPSIKGAAETLLGIAEVIPRAGPVVDARSITVNMGARDERLAGVSVDELTALIGKLRAGQEPGSEAVEAAPEPGG